MTTQGVQLAAREEETYRGRVNNLSPSPHMLGLIREKFHEAQLGVAGATFFGHLQGVDELAFSGQLANELSLRKMANQGVKDLKVSFTQLAYKKEILDKNLVKKVEELSNVVEKLRRVVKEKPMEENTKE
ncbi:hypothetical protein DVH24_002253 [Malus domestica]|uniref:Uncharacterized protein n=1 Tax=Malus domestica TaxID=3750 RepID=A0A498I9U0_MALDO|nr:hypothetical protein DVH24_002253 [Malus domestica]